MKIALLGYGKMGKEIENVAAGRSHSIVLKANSKSNLNAEALSNSDVALDFSTPLSAPHNILQCFDVNVPVVVGTTGWLDQFEEIKQQCIDKNQALFYAPNFSIGVNIFFEINRKLARIMNKQDGYDVSIEETHHAEKLDAPSGTAIKLAEDIVDMNDKKAGWTNSETKNNSDLQITSNRENNITGSHIVKYHSDVDDIKIMHVAHQRKGFAAGAVLAAEWIMGKKGVFGMKDLLEF